MSFRHFLLEQLLVLGTNGEMQSCFLVATGILRRLHHVLLNGCTCPVNVLMEGQQCFRQLPIPHPLVGEQVFEDGLIVVPLQKLLDALALILQTTVVQLLKKCKTGYVLKKNLLKVSLRSVVTC